MCEKNIITGKKYVFYFLIDMYNKQWPIIRVTLFK